MALAGTRQVLKDNTLGSKRFEISRSLMRDAPPRWRTLKFTVGQSVHRYIDGSRFEPLSHFYSQRVYPPSIFIKHGLVVNAWRNSCLRLGEEGKENVENIRLVKEDDLLI